MHVRALVGEGLNDFQGGLVALGIEKDCSPKIERGNTVEHELVASGAAREYDLGEEGANFAGWFGSVFVHERKGLAGGSGDAVIFGRAQRPQIKWAIWIH